MFRIETSHDGAIWEHEESKDSENSFWNLREARAMSKQSPKLIRVKNMSTGGILITIKNGRTVSAITTQLIV